MPVTATHRPRRAGGPRPVRPLSPLPSAVLLLVAAGAGSAIWAAAPPAARTWVGATAAGGWLCLALVTLAAGLPARRDLRRRIAAEAETATARARLAEYGAESARIAGAVLPSLSRQVEHGATAEQALASVALPSDPRLGAVLRAFATELTRAQDRTAAARLAAEDAEARFLALDRDVERYAHETVPLVVSRFRENRNHGDAVHRVALPADPRLAKALDDFAWVTHTGTRRAKVAYGMVRHVLTKVQARNTTILHHLRDMQFRYGQEALKDLFFLDETASQLALSADRIAWMVGGRGSRLWTRPLGMESILRGAIGKIQSYRRVKVHNNSKLSIAGRSAEAIMHLLAEIINNAAQYSAPMDEVHVYVEERTAGIIVTVEDSGLKIPPAALPYLEDCIAGRVLDLAEFRNHHYGLNVVGILAHRFRLTVNFRPSSRGGTGVVVLIPSEHIAQRQPPHPLDAGRDKLPDVTSPGAPPVDRARKRAEETEGAGHAVAPGARGATAVEAELYAQAEAPRGTPAASADTVDATAGSFLDVPAETIGQRGATETPDTPHGSGTPQEPATGAAFAPPALPARSAPSRMPPPTTPPAPAPLPEDGGPRVATEHGLPVRPPGRTMAAVDQALAALEDAESGPPPVRDVGRLFGSFHRAMRAGRAQREAARTDPAAEESAGIPRQEPPQGAEEAPGGAPTTE